MIIYTFPLIAMHYPTCFMHIINLFLCCMPVPLFRTARKLFLCTKKCRAQQNRPGKGVFAIISADIKTLTAIKNIFTIAFDFFLWYNLLAGIQKDPASEKNKTDKTRERNL